MLVDNAYTRFAIVRAKSPPLTSGDTLYWDGMCVISRSAECTPVSESVALAAVPTRDSVFLPASPGLAIDWLAEAVRLTFYLEPGLFLPTVHAMASRVTGTLIWIHDKRDETHITPTVHPALLVHTVYASLHVQYTELVPHLPRHDPLLHHIAMVLQTTVDAEDVAGCLYAKTLVNALAVHLLSRYAICKHLDQPFHGSLTPYKLSRTIAYILAHLEDKLSVSKLAAVAQMSPAHFARLFKCATGQTLHQYVTMCRMEQAKRLLATTDISLSEIGLRVGCSDHSHFAALFRKYISTTPQAYRNSTNPTFV